MESFLAKLESKISVLSEKERKKVIKRYQDEVEKRLKKGMSEGEAIEDLGLFDDIVQDIYEEYHIDSKFASKNRTASETINGWVAASATAVSAFCSDLAKRVKESNNGKGLETFFEIVLKIILLMAAIMVIKLPFVLIEELFTPVFSLLFYPFNTVLEWLLHFALTIGYITCCIIVGIAWFKNYFEPSNKKTEDKINEKAKTEKVVGKTTEDNVEEPVKEKTTGDYLFTIIKVAIFIIMIIPMIAVNFAFLGLAILSAFLVYKGVEIIGLTILLFGFFILTSTLTGYITDALDGKNKSRVVSMIISVVAIIIGSVIFVDNIFSFNYEKDVAKSHFTQKVETSVIDVKDLTGIAAVDGTVEYRTDNELADNELLLEFTYYDKFIDITVKQETTEDKEFLLIYAVKHNLKADMLGYLYENALKDLQDNNIFDYKGLRKYHLVIYCNENTRELIK